MANFNFADRYKAAGLSPSAETITLRQKPFEKIKEDIKTNVVVDVTRLYFGLPTADGAEWFRNAFAEADASFPVIYNAREIAVLSSCILEAAIEDGNDLAALAILTASVAGTRQPSVADGLVATARKALMKIAIDQRSHQIADPKSIKLPAKSKMPAAIETFTTAPDWNKTGELFQQVSQEGRTATRNLNIQVAAVINSLADHAADLREEVDMLWWHIGGWSRLLERPFAELDVGLASTLAGLDLADLSRSVAGPYAAPAILQRTIVKGRDEKLSDVSIADAVNSLQTDDVEKLALGEELKSVPDLCPVLTAYQKAYEVGEPSAWQTSFSRASKIDAAATFPPLDLAMQVYRERSLLAELG